MKRCCSGSDAFFLDVVCVPRQKILEAKNEVWWSELFSQCKQAVAAGLGCAKSAGSCVPHMRLQLGTWDQWGLAFGGGRSNSEERPLN